MEIIQDGILSGYQPQNIRAQQGGPLTLHWLLAHKTGPSQIPPFYSELSVPSMCLHPWVPTTLAADEWAALHR